MTNPRWIDNPGGIDNPRWIDNHCHLGEEAAAWLVEAEALGVEKFIDVGCDLDGSRAATERAEADDRIFATAGIHPHEAERYAGSESTGIDGIAALLTRKRVVAVGECGLDYFYDHSPREAQRQIFADQIGLAHDHDATLVIHTRDAWDETFDILAAVGVPDRVVFHCFTGGPSEARRALDLNAWLSFSGIVTFASATELREAAAMTPVDRLLVETDSPYLAPVPHRGKPNQPAWVTVVGEFLAGNCVQWPEGQGQDPVAELAAATWDNAHAAYPKLAG